MKGFKQKFFAGWAGWSTDNAWKALLIVLLLTVIFGIGYSMLSMEMTFYSMMPQSSSQVRDMKNITENFAFSSQVAVIVDGRSIEDPEEAEEAVIRVIKELEEEFTGAEYSEEIEGVTAGLDRDFVRNHMMMLVEEDDQERFADLFRDVDLVPYLENLNDDYESEYSGNDENLEDDETMVVAQFRGLERILAQLESSVTGGEIDSGEMEEALDEYMFGETWFLSRDNRMGGLFIRPTFNFNDYQMYHKILDWEAISSEISREIRSGSGTYRNDSRSQRRDGFLGKGSCGIHVRSPVSGHRIDDYCLPDEISPLHRWNPPGPRGNMGRGAYGVCGPEAEHRYCHVYDSPCRAGC